MYNSNENIISNGRQSGKNRIPPLITPSLKPVYELVTNYTELEDVAVLVKRETGTGKEIMEGYRQYFKKYYLHNNFSPIKTSTKNKKKEKKND